MLLACDVIADHFGASSQRVGRALLLRGPSSVQDILRFVASECEIDDEPLSFQQVRNSLLVLLQHGVATSKPHPMVANDTAMSSVMHVYSIDIRDVLARLHYPHYLEHVFHAFSLEKGKLYGAMAFQLLQAILCEGRLSEAVALSRAKKGLQQQPISDQFVFTDEQLGEVFRLLTNAGLLRSYTAYEQLDTPAGDALAPPPLADSVPARPANGAASEEQAAAASRKRKAGEDLPGPGGMDGSGAVNGSGESSHTAPAASATAPAQNAAIWGCHRRNLDMCLCKDVVCRLVEETHGATVAQVLHCVLHGVSRTPNDDLAVAVQWLTFTQVEARSKELGFFALSRDVVREREKLNKALTFLKSQSDHLITERQSAAPPSLTASSSAGRAKGKGRSNPKTAAAAQAENDVVETAREWCVEWESVRRVLVKAVSSRYIRDQFGVSGLRIFNLLNDRWPPQKLEEQQIFNTCMVPAEVGREVLYRMCCRHILKWQEVPKTQISLTASFWLYHVDPYSVWMVMLKNYMQTVLNIRISLRRTSARLAPLEEAARFAGVQADAGGRGPASATTTGLGPQERRTLLAGRQLEDALERSFISLDPAVLILTNFSTLPAGTS